VQEAVRGTVHLGDRNGKSAGLYDGQRVPIRGHCQPACTRQRGGERVRGRTPSADSQRAGSFAPAAFSMAGDRSSAMRCAFA